MNYVKTRDATVKKIKKFGKEIALKKKSELSSFDPVLGKEIPIYDPDENGYALEIEYGVKEAQDGWLTEGVKKLMCVGITDPQSGDIITMQNKDFSIVGVKPFSPADIVIYYEVFVK